MPLPVSLTPHELQILSFSMLLAGKQDTGSHIYTCPAVGGAGISLSQRMDWRQPSSVT
jgi:hypothetical protein